MSLFELRYAIESNIPVWTIFAPVVVLLLLYFGKKWIKF